MIEINIDGIVGPTHHFGGLGVGNVASQAHQNQASHPRQAALEGLQKAWLVASLGVPQFVFLPPIRPRLDWLAELGFGGKLEEQLHAAQNAAPRALLAAFSSAFMWMANAATVTASSDSTDGRLHCTLANLISSWHRESEAQERRPQFKLLLKSLSASVVHMPLPTIIPLRDEGAANHMRLCDPASERGFNVFVYGIDEEGDASERPARYLARHTRSASQAVARLHRLNDDRTFFLQQHPAAIDAGVFHNDVIATSCDHMLLHHELAFANADSELQRLENSFNRSSSTHLLRIEVTASELPLADAVKSYFFNSQIVKPTPIKGRASPRYVLICPHHCQHIESATKLVDRLVSDTVIPIDEVRYVQLGESMANGGGPACLRLRIMLSDHELASLNPQLRLTERLFARLSEAINKYYPEVVTANDFCNLDFIDSLRQVDTAMSAAFDGN